MLYCVDVFESERFEDEQEAELAGIQGAFVKYYEFTTLTPDQYITKGLEHVFQYDHDFRSSMNSRKVEFYDLFEKAYYSYIDGDWLSTITHLTAAKDAVRDDGPTLWMLNYIEKNKAAAPEGWNGVRDIDLKQKAPEIQFIRDEEEFEGQD